MPTLTMRVTERIVIAKMIRDTKHTKVARFVLVFLVYIWYCKSNFKLKRIQKEDVVSAAMFFVLCLSGCTQAVAWAAQAAGGTPPVPRGGAPFSDSRS